MWGTNATCGAAVSPSTTGFLGIRLFLVADSWKFGRRFVGERPLEGSLAEQWRFGIYSAASYGGIPVQGFARRMRRQWRDARNMRSQLVEVTSIGLIVLDE